MARHLFIVAPSRPDFFDLWTRRFHGDPKIEVILDRRRGERRQSAHVPGLERRRIDRRRLLEIDKQIRDTGFAIVGPLPA